MNFITSVLEQNKEKKIPIFVTKLIKMEFLPQKKKA